jgi:hypothetical protein
MEDSYQKYSNFCRGTFFPEDENPNAGFSYSAAVALR